MTRRRALLPSLAALLFAALVVSCGGDETAPPTAPGGQTGTPTPPPPAGTGAAPEPGQETTTLAVYLVRGEKVGVAHRRVPETQAVGRAAVEELLEGPTAAEAAAGLHSEIPEGTTLLDLSIEDGVATVDLSSEYAGGGGSLTMFVRLAQVVYTLTQYPTVTGVSFELDGEPVETFSAEGIVLDHPQGRSDYEDQTPAILVETPAVGDTVSSPLRLTGTANTFEATLQYELLDAAGDTIAEKFATATCGTGCRGTFDVSVPFAYEGEPRGILRVFELSAKDGSETNVVEIPLAFEPAGAPG